MVYPLLSYVQIRVSVILSLGYRFSIAGLWSLGVTLEVGCFGLPLPSCDSFTCRWGFVPWFLSLLCGTNLDEPVFGLHIDFLCVGHCGAQSMPELGRSLVYWSLWYMLPSPLIWFSFVESWSRVWVSPPLVLVIDFWFGIPVSLGVCSWLTWSLPGVSLSIDLKSLIGSLIVDWAFANLYSITECTQLGPCWTKWPLALYWFRCIGSTCGSDAWHCDFSYCILLYHLCMIYI